VYITTTNSLDWPKSQNKTEQQTSLKKIVADLKAANFNAIFFQVRARGDAYYKSEFEPWAENLTGTLGKDPGWDPLQFLLDESRKHGMEVHAWFNVYKVRGPVLPPASSPKHPALAFPDWVAQHENEWWFDPGIPEVRTYLIRLLTDLATNYRIDGICYDFIRYPGKDFQDSKTYERYGRKQPIDQWRRTNINTFVREAYKAIMRTNPAIKVGAAPVGNYGGALSAQPNTKNSAGGFGDFSQDSRVWMKYGWLDYLAPQVYWTLEFDTRGPDFAHIARAWQRDAAGRHVYISIGAYKPEIFSQIPDQITATRMLGAQGQVFFRYENVQAMDMCGTLYAEPVAVPPMPWKADSSNRNIRK
jgi:uncharacterized lipoprotein YddW (UPF0748 family)